MGPQPVATQVHPSQPAQHHHNYQQQQQFSRQQQKQHHNCSPIYAQHRWKVQKIVYEERDTGTFQRHQHTSDSIRKPQGQGPQNNQTRIIYHYQCPQINCPWAYIGEWGRSLGERVKEHFKAPSPIHHHSTTTGHPMDPDQFNIVHKEVNSHYRTIKEAMFIQVQDPTLNRILQSTSYCTYGTTSFRHHPPYSVSLQTIQLHPQPPKPLLVPPPPLTHTPPTVHNGGSTYFFLW